MASTTAIHQSDLAIVRTWGSQGQTAVLDADGELFETFPPEMTDEQIRFCIGLINRHYDLGVRLGEARKANQIKSALGIN
ncbi:hypothetical protein E4188_22670 (plasmid) [Aeromonas media]|uniref:Uncharacterized protein n=1 Tax=Aeromonas media TaxID=651 RepID=A0ABX6NZP3_AERME|nr:hypothetical protein [Aeromonas media]QJT37094.1 hypothetical protein E4187_22655 [Aeromonas media]QJT41304.1 hypothetical protein E4188_22670 [Aeromonas media]